MKTQLETHINLNTELNLKLQDLQSKPSKFLGKYEEKRILSEVKDLLNENEQLKNLGRELKSELEYSKQRENKLMYFLYIMQKKDYPVYEIFEQHIKDIQTSRFTSNNDEDFKRLFQKQVC